MSETTTLSSAPSFRWFMLLLNILAYGQFFLTVQIPTVFSSYITADLGVSAMTVSLCGTIILGVFALTGGFGARLVAKFGLKLSICIAIIVNIIGALLILVIGHSFPGYAVCCAIEGLSGGLICGPITTINTYWFPIRERGIASGILLGILGVAFSIDTFFAPKIMASGVAWQTGASLLAAIPSIAIVIIYFLFAREVAQVYQGRLTVAEMLPAEAETSPKSNVENLPKSMDELKKHSYLWFAVICGFITGANVYGFPSFVNGLLLEKGIDMALANGVASITFFTSILGSPLGGLISDKVFKGSRWQIVCIGNIVIAASLLIVAVSGGTLLAVFMVIAYAAVSTVMGPFWAIPPELGHPSIAAEASGFCLIFGNLGGTIIGFVLTAVASATGTYYMPMFICMGMAVVSALLVSRIKR